MVIGRKLYPLRWMKNKFHLFEAIVAVTWFRYPASKLQVIGVTGTDGKTTTATLIYHLLKTAGFKVACITTVAAYIGKDLIDTGFHVTTPSSWSLQKLLRRIADQGYTQVVLETTSHGLDQNRVFGTNISLAVITNITHEHLDYHHTLDEYIKAKAKIFQHARVAVLNADDNAYQMLKTKLASSTRLIPYSLKKNGGVA